MKIWIITIEDVCDYASYYHAPLAFSKEEDARTQLDVFKKSIQTDYKTEIGNGWVYEDGDNSAEVYKDGYYGEEHYSVVLKEIELK